MLRLLDTLLTLLFTRHTVGRGDDEMQNATAELSAPPHHGPPGAVSPSPAHPGDGAPTAKCLVSG